tara:strand:+ start:1088 stop:2245 length:1158 start_codon:yes stop_codon:yes gene_type:complete
MYVKLENIFCQQPEALKSLIEQIYYVDHRILNCDYNGNGLNIEFDLGCEIDEEYLMVEIQKISLSTMQSFERVETKILFENEGTGSYDQDPMEELLNSKQVIETFPGVYILQGKILKCIKEMDSIFRTYAIERGAKEQHFQPTLSTKSLIENGYISSFPHHPLFVASVVRDANRIKNLSKDAKEKHKNKIHQYEWLDNRLDTHEQVLSPTVCYHCFEALRDQSISNVGAQFTAIASCHRNESRNIKGLSRLQSFTMREIVFLGSTDFVKTCRNEILSHCQSCLVDWNLKFRVVTASDPFFTSGSETKRVYQTVLELKYEIQAYLPHSESWLSIASFNNHEQSLVKSYGIDFDLKDQPLHSGCVGYGYERMAYAFYSQFGLDSSIP